GTSRPPSVTGCASSRSLSVAASPHLSEENRSRRHTIAEMQPDLSARERLRYAPASRGVCEPGDNQGSKDFIRFALPVTQHARRHDNAIVKTLHGYSLSSKMIRHG